MIFFNSELMPPPTPSPLDAIDATCLKLVLTRGHLHGDHCLPYPVLCGRRLGELSTFSESSLSFHKERILTPLGGDRRGDPGTLHHCVPPHGLGLYWRHRQQGGWNVDVAIAVVPRVRYHTFIMTFAHSRRFHSLNYHFIDTDRVRILSVFSLPFFNFTYREGKYPIAYFQFEAAYEEIFPHSWPCKLKNQRVFKYQLSVCFEYEWIFEDNSCINWSIASKGKLPLLPM